MDRTTALYLNALSDLEGRMGVKPSEILPEEQVALVKACERMADPFSEVNADAAGMPVKVCAGVYLWRLTCGASVWLDECAEKWWGTDTEKYNKAFVWASANARNASAFEGADTREGAYRKIRAFFARLPATPDEVSAAVDEALGIRTREVRREDVACVATDWSAILARVESQTGVKRAELTWLTSCGYLMKLYNDLSRFAEAHNGQPGYVGHLRDELDAATEALQIVKVGIMKRVKVGSQHG